MQFQQFDDMEQAMAAMREAEAAANLRVTDAQRAIDFGTHWLKPMGPDYDYMFIFGRNQTLDEYLASELLGVTSFSDEARYGAACEEARRLLSELDLTADRDISLARAMRGQIEPDAVTARLAELSVGPNPRVSQEAFDEFRWSFDSMRDSYMRGYRYGRAYSLMEPRGEFGSTHISQMAQLTADEFADAEAAGWDFRLLSAHSSPHRKDWAVEMVMRGSNVLFDRQV